MTDKIRIIRVDTKDVGRDMDPCELLEQKVNTFLETTPNIKEIRYTMCTRNDWATVYSCLIHYQ